MELSALSENIVTIPFNRAGESDELYVNSDAFTPDFFREVGKRFKERVDGLQVEDKKRKKKDQVFFEDEARALELKREIYAEMLSSGVLTDWTFTENGEPTKPTKDVLLTLPPRLIAEFWELCLEAAKTVKKREDVEEEATLDRIPSGSMALRAVGQNG
jgi:hypothetical protein